MTLGWPILLYVYQQAAYQVYKKLKDCMDYVEVIPEEPIVYEDSGIQVTPEPVQTRDFGIIVKPIPIEMHDFGQTCHPPKKLLMHKSCQVNTIIQTMEMGLNSKPKTLTRDKSQHYFDSEELGDQIFSPIKVDHQPHQPLLQKKPTLNYQQMMQPMAQ